MSDRTVILVPCRDAEHGGSPWRDRLWEFCRDRLIDEFDYPIIEGHHNDGPFNRSAAINKAAAVEEWDRAIIMDRDVLVEAAQIRAALRVATETGRLTLAYSEYAPLTEAATRKLLDDGLASMRSGIDTSALNPYHVSSCIVVTRDLWNRVGGFDERFLGWGPEDSAFAESCRVLGGGIEQVPGRVWHLWHPWSAERDPRSGLAKAAEALISTYWSTVEPVDMERFVADRQHDGVMLAFITNGRRECIPQAIESAHRMLNGPIRRQVIIDDSGDINYRAWLRYTYDQFEVIATPGERRGFDVAYTTLWRTFLGSGLSWLFNVEDDFTFEREVDLTAMAAVMRANPHLTQMSLRRQPWFPPEIAAGGIIEQHPGDYMDCADLDGHEWMEHRRFVTSNPSLWHRDFAAHHPWPSGAHSENRLTDDALKDPTAKSGYWGTRTDAPWVIHDGQRVGTGY